MTIDSAGEHLAAHALATPDRVALVMHPSGATSTYGDIDERSTSLAHALRERGLEVGDHLALLLQNQEEFFTVVWAALRMGVYITPINWHLTANEAGYIVSNCGAKALVASAHLSQVVAAMDADLDGVPIRISVDGELPTFERYDEVLATSTSGPLAEQREGEWMFYSSGTTGRPKGILPPLADGDLGAPSLLTLLLGGIFGLDSNTVYLSPAPLYHAAPAG